METLFTDLPVSKSLRLLWMERHGIETWNEPDASPPWVAFTIKPQHKGEGSTEGDALTALAKAAGIRMWFEPQD
jgi:hypothetical protein